MQTVIETHAYLSAAKSAGMTQEEMISAVDTVSANPTAGDVIVGSNGCRKVRIVGRGKGKSGGYRVITYFVSTKGVYLLMVLSKGKTANLTAAQINTLETVARTLA